MKMVLGVVRPEMAIDFGFKEVEPRLMRGAVHGQPTHCFWGLLKIVREVILDRKCPCVLLA